MVEEIRSPQNKFVTSRLQQEVVLKFRYNLPMHNIKRNKHVKKILLVERDGQFKSDTHAILIIRGFCSLQSF